VQAPELTVVDNKAATVFVGEQIHFAEEFSTTNQGGQLSKGIREASQNSPVKVGTQLMIMPHIIPDSNKVILQVIPTSEQLTGTTSPTVSGFERFQVADSFIDLPRMSSRTVVTTMLLEDGQTAVIGGLINVSKTDSRTKLPWLGDIPVIGWLFKNKAGNTTINNLYIFITIRIMRNSADVQSVFAEFDVPGAHMKPYKPGMPFDAVSLDEKDMPAEKSSSPAAAPAPAPAPSAAKDTVGSGWEESEQGVEKFDVKK
jgi:general secretion pathway protein D